MSAETSTWLNQRTLIGMTDKRGNAWHYRESDQGAESNHYPDAIPTDDIVRRLFYWAPAEGDVTSTYIDESGVTTVTDPTRKTIVRPAGTFGADDAGEILGIFKLGYQVHNPRVWLLEEVAAILGQGLRAGSAGLLAGGGVAFVQCELDENVNTPEGVTFRPFIMASTSCNGSLSTTYNTGSQWVVCDNTQQIALAESRALGTMAKVRHSKRSNDEASRGRIRDALQLVHTVADETSAAIAQLAAIDVSDKAWTAFLAAHAPITAGDDKSISKTLAEKRRGELTQLWEHDARVSPWKGTALGVVQAVNTHAHHVQTSRGMERAERNMTRAVDGDWGKLHVATMAQLTKVLATV